MTDAWATNTDAAALARWLHGAARVTILTHVKPDGDAVGSTLALARALRVCGVEAAPWYVGPLPAWLADVAGDTPWAHAGPGAGAPDADAWVILDTGSRKQLDALAPWVAERAARAAIVDHHLHGDADLASRRWISTEAAAVCQPVARLCAALLGLDAIDRLPSGVARALYLGIATDTGWFRNSNVGPEVMRDAADLLACGVDHPSLYELVEQRDTEGHLRFLGALLSSMRIELDGRVALLAADDALLRRCGVSEAESGGIVDKPLAIAGVRVAALLTPWERGVKISLRSKAGPGAIDVNAIAQRLGGGGHARAAGAKTPLSLGAATDALLAALREALGGGTP